MNNLTNVNKIDDEKIKAFAYELQYFIEDAKDNANFEDTFKFVTERAAEIVGLKDEYYDRWIENCGLCEIANLTLRWLLGCRELLPFKGRYDEYLNKLKSLDDYGVARLVSSMFISYANSYMPYGIWGRITTYDLEHGE